MDKKERTISVLQGNKIVPVVVIEDVANAVPLAEALLKGGCNIMEVTMRTEAAIPALEAIRAALPHMIVGMGTVTNKDMYKKAEYYGAQFIVSPGSSSELLSHAQDNGLPFLPGVMTSSEIMVAREYGFLVQKFFPAALAGGISAIKTFGSVYGDVLFFPTGGITGVNYRDYLAEKNIIALGGTWIATKDDVSKGNWAQITARVQALK